MSAGFRLERSYKASEGVKVVQELLRHATSRITVDVYQQGSTEAKRLALDRVAGIFAVLTEDAQAAE